MSNEKNFETVGTLAMEGFNPNDYAKPYDEQPNEHYLPYDIQRWWFANVCPNGRIVVSEPKQDAEHTPGAYVATAMVWKDKNTEKEDICISSRAVPAEGATIDTYQDCQRKAISLALKTLGFWLTPSKETTIPMTEPVVGESVDTHPAENDSVDSKPETPTVPVNAETQEPVSEPPKRRGRKPKAEATENTENTVPTTTETEPVAEPAPETPVETTSTTAPAPSSEVTPVEETGMSLEEAREVVVNYRNWCGTTIGQLMDSTDKRDADLLNWFATSSMASRKFPKEAEAAKVVLATK